MCSLVLNNCLLGYLMESFIACVKENIKIKTQGRRHWIYDQYAIKCSL